MLADFFPEFGQTRVPMPGEHATVSVSLEYDTAQEIDDVCARAAKLGAKIETRRPIPSGARATRSCATPSAIAGY